MGSWKRQEVIGDCTLYLGDCREILPAIHDCIDAVITDPVWPNCPPNLIPGSENPQALWNETIAMLPPVRRLVAVMRCDSDPRFLSPVKLDYARSVILPYVMPGYIGRLLGGDEIAYCFGELIMSAPGQRVIPGRAPAVQPTGRKANGHPCSRALGHFMFLLRWWSQPGELVLDPFMGSGTTGVAAFLHGRRFVGIEIEETYFDIACKRLEDESKEPRLFREAAPISAIQEVMDL